MFLALVCAAANTKAHFHMYIWELNIDSVHTRLMPKQKGVCVSSIHSTPAPNFPLPTPAHPHLISSSTQAEQSLQVLSPPF